MTPEQYPKEASTQEKPVPHSGKSNLEFPLPRHDDGVELHEVAKDLPAADMSNLQPTTEELELIRVHREQRAKEQANEKRLPGWLTPVSIIGATAITAAGLFLWPKGESDNKTAPAPINPVATAPATPGSTPTASAVETTVPAPIETTPSAEIILEQKTSIEAMDAMTINEYAKLPYADRLAYALEKVPELADTLESTKNFAKDDPQYITAGLWHEIRQASLFADDPLEGSKIFFAKELYSTQLGTGEIGSEDQKTVDSIYAAGGGVHSTEDLTYESSGQWQTGVDRSGNPIQFVNITHSLINRQGDAVPGSQMTTQAIEVTVRTLDGTVHMAYPAGYDIAGKASPDSNYPY